MVENGHLEIERYEKKLDSKKKGDERDEDRNNSDETQNEMENSGM
jgi:hypothetical protein